MNTTNNNQAPHQMMITKAQAQKRGLRPLSGPYSEREKWMIENICADLRRGDITHAVIKTENSFEVWRTGIGWRENEKA